MINAIFFFEFLVKVIAMGFFLNSGCYLTDNWNKLDFLIVIFSLMDLILEAYNFKFIKVSFINLRL